MTSCSPCAGSTRGAVAEFVWPEVGPEFNWAVDWFDDDRPRATTGRRWCIVEEDGRRARVTYDEMRRRSNRVAGWLRARGVAAATAWW